MTSSEFNKRIGKLRSQKQKLINETFWWVSITRTSLEKSLLDPGFQDNLKISVPSKGRIKTITRDFSQLEEIINRIKDRDLLFSIFVFLIAQIEDFLSEFMRLILLKDQRRIKCNVKGLDLVKKLDVIAIVDGSKPDLIKEIIEKNITSVFYASPQKQREYFEKALGIHLSESYWTKWFEYKATRDIIVHNQGKVNDFYLLKAGDRSRGFEGDTITIDTRYFSDFVATMKSFVGKCENLAKEELKTANGKYRKE